MSKKSWRALQVAAVCLFLASAQEARLAAKKTAQAAGEKSCCEKAALLDQAVEALKEANDLLQRENEELRKELAACKARQGKS